MPNITQIPPQHCPNYPSTLPKFPLNLALNTPTSSNLRFHSKFKLFHNTLLLDRGSVEKKNIIREYLARTMPRVSHRSFAQRLTITLRSIITAAGHCQVLIVDSSIGGLSAIAAAHATMTLCKALIQLYSLRCGAHEHKAAQRPGLSAKIRVHRQQGQ